MPLFIYIFSGRQFINCEAPLVLSTILTQDLLLTEKLFNQFYFRLKTLKNQLPSTHLSTLVSHVKSCGVGFGVRKRDSGKQ